MSGKALLDTNVVIAILNQETAVARLLESVRDIFLPAVVVGELYYGAWNSARTTSNLQTVRDFAARVTVLPVDEITAVHYGEIRSKLRRKGKPLPENDIWIAASAMQHNLPLATRDRHFEVIDGLDLLLP